MVRPILRLATRLTRRTRATAWAVAFACMVLVGTLSLADGLAGGVGSVVDRIGSGPTVYIRGDELLASAMDPDAVAGIPGDFLAVRVHPADLEINRIHLSIVVVALEAYANGTATSAYPVGHDDLSLDVGLAARVQAISGNPPSAIANLSVFGPRLTGLPVVPPPPNRSPLFADDWAYVRPELLYSIDPAQGGPIQAIVADVPLDPGVIATLGLTRLETLGAVGFVQSGLAEVQSSLRLLAIVIAVVIGLLVYAAMGLEVHQRAGEIAMLRRLGASPAVVASVYESQAFVLAIAGAALGSALGIVAAHAVVSFAPILGLPNLVILAPPGGPVGLAFVVALLAAGLAGIVPARRAAVLVRRPREAIPSS